MKKLLVFQLTFIFTLLLGFTVMAQEESSDMEESTDMYENEDSRPELQNFRYNDQRGLNIFEAPKDNTPYRGFGLRVGGDFAVQWQSISQSTGLAATDSLGNPTGGTVELPELGANFNLPTANLNLDAQLYDGVRLHMRMYLSSRHHEEGWVKGGYVRIDKLDFIKKDFLSGVMDVLFIKAGYDEINYGDAHFRRTDNGRAIYNPFVGNYIMDAFTTEPFLEFNVLHPSGVLGVIGASNGRLNQNVVENNDQGVTIYGKLGYDKQMNDDLRLRLTGSFYSSSSTEGDFANPSGRNVQRDYLYAGDRAGGRYYGLFGTTGDDFSPRFNPRWSSVTAIQVNPFVKFKGIEFFGVFETSSNNVDFAIENGVENREGGNVTQLGAELLYRFGGREQFYVGGRYNSVSGDVFKTEVQGAKTDIEITRINAGAGWFMTRNMLAKLEYVTNTYGGGFYDGSEFEGGEWNGLVIEAAISF
jgi:hypothetical protein